MRELLQLPQLLWLPWVVMSRAPDWREQQNSHFLPCWGPASCGCQPGGGVKLLWLLRQPQPGPCLGPYCAPGAWCPALPQLSGVLGSHPVFLQLCKQHSLLQRFPGPPHLLGKSLQFPFIPARGHSPTCGNPRPSRVLPPNALSAPSLSMATAPGSSSLTGLPISCLCFKNNHYYPHVSTITTHGQQIASFTPPPPPPKSNKLLITPVAVPSTNIKRNDD